MTDFFQRIEERTENIGSLLCVGLDPRIDSQAKDPEKDLFQWSMNIVEKTADYAACFKPNIAFFEAWGREGISALKKIMESIPTEIPVILDAKRGDIGSTAEAYVKSVYGFYQADAVTLSPYMGKDTIDPFLDDRSKGVFLLCRTSNPGSPAFQDLSVEGRPLYVYGAGEMTSWNSRIGLVVAGNDITALKNVREVCPETWFLAPGIGAQGGTAEDAFSAGGRKDGKGLLVNVSRGIASADDPAKAAAQFAEDMRKASSSVQTEGVTLRDHLKEQVLNGLIKTECFKTGEFVLKSGKQSPFYIDLRRVQSDPVLLKQTAKAYAGLLKGLQFDRIAGIPVAALPLATAVSLEAGIPLIYPRMTVKGHGTGNKVEGNWKKGERIVLLDDLITTGKSKIEAVEILREAGLVVEDLIVLIERGVQGRQDMEENGINLHSYCGVEDLLDRCKALKLLSESDHKDMIAYAQEG